MKASNSPTRTFFKFEVCISCMYTLLGGRGTAYEISHSNQSFQLRKIKDKITDLTCTNVDHSCAECDLKSLAKSE